MGCTVLCGQHDGWGSGGAETTHLPDYVLDLCGYVLGDIQAHAVKCLKAVLDIGSVTGLPDDLA